MKEEMVDVIDDNDKVIKTVPRAEIRKNNLGHRSAHLLIFNSKRELLITKRSEDKDIEPGFYEYPAGMLSANESYEENAKREIYEEPGIQNPEMEFLFDFRYKDDIRNQFIRVFKVIYDGNIKPMDGEVTDYVFLPKDKLQETIKEKKDRFCKNRIAVLEKYLGEKLT
ncbi:MAG: NUDIX domain-containing protein [Nanoarchaeota archaeon]|nr:NUDIX domain-containing protein [Nanoarchaeota archaeon]